MVFIRELSSTILMLMPSSPFFWSFEVEFEIKGRHPFDGNSYRGVSTINQACTQTLHTNIQSGWTSNKQYLRGYELCLPTSDCTALQIG